MKTKLQPHAEWLAELEVIRKRNEIRYRGWIIEPSTSYLGGFDYYPEDEGRNDDCDCVGDPAEYMYCGNVRHACTIEGAKDDIWERAMMKQPQHIVVLHNKKYPFDWIEDAIKFAVLWNAEGFYPAT